MISILVWLVLQRVLTTSHDCGVFCTCSINAIADIRVTLNCFETIVSGHGICWPICINLKNCLKAIECTLISAILIDVHTVCNLPQTDEPEGEEEYDHFTDEEEFEVKMPWHHSFQNWNAISVLFSIKKTSTIWWNLQYNCRVGSLWINTFPLFYIYHGLCNLLYQYNDTV